MAVVLFTTAFQSFHALSHTLPSLELNHEHSTAQQEDEHFHFFTSESADSEHSNCSICDFHFDLFVQPTPIHLRVDFPFYAIQYVVSCIEGEPNFNGSLYAHRGPPTEV